MEADFVGRIVLFFVRGFALFYGYLPRRVQVLFGIWLGNLFYWLKIRSSVVQGNLAIAYPHQQKFPKKQLLALYRHLGNLALELLLILGPMKRFVLKYVDADIRHWEEASRLNKGVIVLSSHVGNWEVASAAGAIFKNANVLLVTKRLKPSWLHEAIERGRLKYGVRATYEPKTFRDILSHLKNKGTIGIVLDQYLGPPVGVRVPVFGVPVGTSPVVATLAKRTGAVVVPVVSFRTPDGRWKVIAEPPLTWKEHPDSSYEIALNTSEYAKVIERHILEHSDQWLWNHRRFKGDLSPLKDAEWYGGRARS